MYYEKNKEKSLKPELFKNPTSEYRGAPFWAWNCEIDRDELLRQIDIFKQMGLGGFHMHVRTGLSTPYLSDEFMSYIKSCVEKAKQEDMLAYLYDEDRWPSGSAGGFVTKTDEYRQRYLRITPFPYITAKDDVSDLEDSRDLTIRTENGSYVATFDIVLDDNGYLKSYNLIDKDAKAVGTKWYAYLDYCVKSSWFNNESYVDTLNKKAIDKFIDITYKAYDKTCGDEFGKTVPSIFTDEPQVSQKEQLPYATDQVDVTLPWTPDLADTFSKTYGEDLIAGIPELFWDLPGGKTSVIRYHYHDHLTERFVEAFADNCGKWCREHNLMLTGHMMEEPTLDSQTHSLGEAMRNYRGFDLPGIDMLCSQREFTTAKQAQSAVHQYGREAMLSELYGVTGWDFDFRGHKINGDWQAALGVTLRVHHLSWLSMKGEAKRDYPASISYQSSWYSEYKNVEDHFARVNTALTRGTPVVNVAVIHPVESFWLHWGPNEQTNAIREEMNGNFLSVTDWLVKGLIDFDFISESLLPEQCEKGSAPLKVGKMAYDVIIVPQCETLRSTTLERLEKFKAEGGKLVFMGSAPTLENAVPSDRGLKLYNDSINIGFTKNALLNTLNSDRKIEIRYSDGRVTNRFCHQIRKDNDCKWLFIAQTNKPSNKDVSRFDDIDIYINGEFGATLFDTETGETMELPCKYKNGKTVISRRMYEYDSLLLCLKPGKSTMPQPEAIKTESISVKVPDTVDFTLSEPNVLLMDMAEFKLDDGEYQPEEEIYILDNKLRESLGMSLRGSAIAQPWVVSSEAPKHTVSLRFTVNSKLALSGLKLALEDADIAKIVVNGKPVANKINGWYVDKSIETVDIPDLVNGKNTVEVTLPLGPRTNTEWCYILGNFGVNVVGRNKWLTKMPAQLSFGDIKPQGLPFYGGKITYHLPVTSTGKKVKINVPHYVGALVTVTVDGDKKSIIYPPYIAEFSLTSGRHMADITLYCNRYNSFGCVHNIDLNYRWLGANSWRTEGDEWTYEYRLKDMGIISTPIVTEG